ncbi:MAG: efflux RND transporter periplasmic adaptor subunit [Phycisphaerales bacterium]|nr:efflux RND transporter periplasmic adaptor subunit [Phycisphaerales bacterium]
MKKRGKVIAVFIVAVLIANALAVLAYMERRYLFGGSGPPVQAAVFEPAEAVEIVDAHEESWQPTADLVGTVFPIRAVTVRNEVAGVVTFVGFQSGGVIEEGQVLLRLDDTTARADLAAMRAAVRVAEANVTQSESQVALAEAELGRLTGVESRAVAEMEVDRARTKLETAKADGGRWAAEVDQARAHVAQAEAHLAKLTIAAPFRSRAGMRTVNEGQYLAEGSEVVALQELTDTIYLDFAVPQEYASRVKVGTAVMASAPLLGPDPVKIEVVAVDAVVSLDTRNLRVRSIVDNPGGTLVPGMFVQVRVPIEAPRQVVVVPRMAVHRAAYGNSVFVIAPDDKGEARAHQRFVTLAETIGEDIVVAKGLSPGERVAGAGSFKLRDGAKVMMAPPGGAPPPEDGGGKEASAGDGRQ